MKPFLTTCSLSLAFVFCYAGISDAHHGGATAYAIALTAIQIDGDLDDWPEETIQYPILNHAKVYGPTDIDTADLATSTDLSPSFMVGYHSQESLLYLAVRVRDDSLVANSADPWHTDACEVFLNGRHGDRTALQYVMCPPGGSYGDELRSADPSANPNLAAGDISKARTKGVVSRKKGVTVYEWAIEVFDTYPDSPTALAAGKTIGFDVVAVDKDSQTDSPAWICWAPFGVRKDLNADLLGDLVLIESYAALGMIAGQVTRPSDGSPWPGVKIRVVDPEGKTRVEATTGADGRYLVQVQKGSYKVAVANAAGGEPVAVSLQAGERVGGIDFAPALGTIAGRVARTDGSPWPGVKIRVEGQEGNTGADATTDAEGRYQAWAAPGSYQVSVVDARGAVTVTVSLQAGEQAVGIDFAPTAVGSTLPTWPFTTGLSVTGVAILACLVPLAQRRGRLGGILLSPGRTFQEVAEQPDWVGPFFLVLVSALVASVTTIGKMLTVMGRSTGGMPGGMQIVMLVVMPLVATIALVVYTYLAWLVRTGLIWLLARMSGKRVRFYPLLSTMGYAYLPEMLLAGLVMAVAFGFGGAQASDPWSAMVTSVAGLLPDLAAGNAPLRVLLGEIELFSLWSLVLVIVGTQRVYGFSMRKAAVIGILYWLLAVGAMVGFVALADVVKQMVTGS
jgi:hypothetical protein